MLSLSLYLQKRLILGVSDFSSVDEIRVEPVVLGRVIFGVFSAHVSIDLKSEILRRRAPQNDVAILIPV